MSEARWEENRLPLRKIALKKDENIEKRKKSCEGWHRHALVFLCPLQNTSTRDRPWDFPKIPLEISRVKATKKRKEHAWEGRVKRAPPQLRKPSCFEKYERGMMKKCMPSDKFSPGYREKLKNEIPTSIYSDTNFNSTFWTLYVVTTVSWEG